RAGARTTAKSARPPARTSTADGVAKYAPSGSTASTRCAPPATLAKEYRPRASVRATAPVSRRTCANGSARGVLPGASSTVNEPVIPASASARQNAGAPSNVLRALSCTDDAPVRPASGNVVVHHDADSATSNDRV